MRIALRVGFALVGVLAVYVLLDVAARFYVQMRVESELRDSNRLHAEGVDVHIDSFPFLAPLLVSGEVDATITLDEVGTRDIRIDEFEIEVDGLVFDRDEAFRGHPHVTDVDQATVRATLSTETLSELFGTEVDLSQVRAAIGDRGLRLTVPQVGEATVPMDAEAYFPCPPAVEFTADTVEVSCTTTDLPPVVDQVLVEATGRG